jgi:transglutaminase-like putative cysteine protease
MKSQESTATDRASESLEYLQPSSLCDFHRHPEIKEKAIAIAGDYRNHREVFQRIFAFVKELPYGLEDWDVPASETLAKGWGMCSGKTNLLVAMLRSLGIPARYRAYQIKTEGRLWRWLTGDAYLARRMGPPPREQDHVDCQVWLGSWEDCDPARDTLMERGMASLGMPLRREVIPAQDGKPYLCLASIDRWACERQQRRRFQKDRAELFARANRRLEELRRLAGGRREG